MIVTYLVAGIYFSLSQIFFEMKFSPFKELPSPVLNFLDFCNCLQNSEAKLLQISTPIYSISVICSHLAGKEIKIKTKIKIKIKIKKKLAGKLT